MKKLLLLPVFIIFTLGALFAQNDIYKLEENIFYLDVKEKDDAYALEKCRLDVYYPENKSDVPTIIWFHGGGLSGGDKEIPDELKKQGFCVVGVGYRLHPQVQAPVYIEDAAAATAWVFNNIEKYSGSASRVFISGHSAGGYLAMMIGLDKSWLAQHGVDADKIAGLIPFSGQAITHFTIRKERGLGEKQATIDKYGPIFHARADAPPLTLITGDRELELLGRYEENAYLLRMMKLHGHAKTKLYELDGYGHDMLWPAYPLLINEVKRINEELD